MTTQNQNYSEKANKLSSELWEMANALRGNIDSSKFKDYIFGIIFYRFLSEKVEAMAKKTFEDDGCTYEEMMESLSNRKVRQYIKDPSKYKKMCNNFNRKYENSRFKISDIFMCKRVIMKCIPELEEDYVNKFIMLFCKVCENKNPDNIEDHVFMYYTIQNIRLLEHDKLDEMIEDKRSDMYLTVTENIKKVIEKIKSVETVKGGK